MTLTPNQTAELGRMLGTIALMVRDAAGRDARANLLGDIRQHLDHEIRRLRIDNAADNIRDRHTPGGTYLGTDTPRRDRTPPPRRAYTPTAPGRWTTTARNTR